MRIKRIFALGIVLLLSGCTTFYSLSGHTVDDPKTFNEYLVKGYHDLSTANVKRLQFSTADYFAKKGLRALDSQAVMPEPLVYWTIRDPKQKKELEWGVRRLLPLLTDDMKKKYPAQLAEAQVLYDCWVQQSEEGMTPSHENQCRLDFLMAVSALQNKMAGLTSGAEIPKTSDVMLTEEHYTIYFAFASAKVDAKGKAVVDTVVDDLKPLGGNYILELAGYTDTAGPKEYNEYLSRSRANAVAKEFVKKGIPKKQIYKRYYGEKDLAVKTADNTPNRLNRRVVVELAGHPKP